jgi:hypothetical protein
VSSRCSHAHRDVPTRDRRLCEAGFSRIVNPWTLKASSAALKMRLEVSWSWVDVHPEASAAHAIGRSCESSRRALARWKPCKHAASGSSGWIEQSGGSSRRGSRREWFGRSISSGSA